MSKTSTEVAGEITVALIAKLVFPSSVEGLRMATPEILAPKIAEAFKIIYKAVQEA